MELFTAQQDQIRKYLLGNSEPEEVEGIEKRLLTDENFLQEFCIVKDELVDDYVSGALSAADATQFETQFFSTPRLALKVRMARALAERARSYTRDPSEPVDEYPALPEQISIPPIPIRPRLQGYWPVAAGLAVMLLAGFLAWRTLQDHPRQPSAGDQRRLQLESELARLNDPNSEPPLNSTAAVTLTPVSVSVRSIGDDRRVVVSEGGETPLLRLELAGPFFESYRASLQTDEGVELAKIQNLKPIVDGKDRIARVRLPGKQLNPGGYRIRLSGLGPSGSFEEVGSYPFQIVKG